MSLSMCRCFLSACIALGSLTPQSLGDDAERIAKLEATVRTQRELLIELGAQLNHERTAVKLGYEELHDKSHAVRSLLKSGSVLSGVDARGRTIAFRVVSTSGSDVFLESAGEARDRLLLRVSCRADSLQLRSVWLKGVDYRQLRWSGQGVVNGNTVELKYSYTLNGVTHDQSVVLTPELMIAEVPE
jgi:hypothetical protein